MYWQLFLVPLSSAFSCWLVIKLFFTILFHPRTPRSVLGIRIQGVVPAKQSAVATMTAKLVTEKFLSMDLIEEKVSDPAILQKIMPVIGEHIDDFLRNKLKKQMPFIGMFVGDKTINSLKTVFITELETLFPIIMKKYASTLFSELNIEHIVYQKITAISTDKLEADIKRSYRKEWAIIQLISCLTGFIIGLISMLMIIYIK